MQEPRALPQYHNCAISSSAYGRDTDTGLGTDLAADDLRSISTLRQLDNSDSDASRSRLE